MRIKACCFKYTHTHTHTHAYIYIYVCVCVCVYSNKKKQGFIHNEYKSIKRKGKDTLANQLRSSLNRAKSRIISIKKPREICRVAKKIVFFPTPNIFPIDFLN